MRRRIITVIILVFAINISIGSIYFFNKTETPVIVGDEIGAVYYPYGIAGIDGITEDMGAAEMFLIGLKNFEENAPYAASTQTGSVEGGMAMSLLSDAKFSNALSSIRIRQDGVQFWRTATMSVEMLMGQDIRQYEEAYIKDGKYYYRTADKKKIISAEGAITVADENPFMPPGEAQSKGDPACYESAEEYYGDNNFTDPKRLSMHTFNEKTIINTTTPVKSDKVNKAYTYTFEVDVNNGGIDDYIEVVKSTMGESIRNGLGPNGISFSYVQVKVTQWDNGLIKEVEFTERYYIDYAGGINMTMNAVTYFSYDNAEEKYQVKDYIW